MSEPPRAGGLRALVAGHRAMAGLALVALVPLFANLGAGTLWADEGDTAVFARAILETGLPMAWDGATFTDSDMGRRLTPGLLLVGTPWAPYYVTAASFAVFGESTFAARFPFAIAGLATLVAVYALVWRWTASRLAAFLAALLLLGSVQFLLYARQCRHYALNMLLSTSLVLAFERLARGRVDALFVAIAALLFHCHPLPAAVTLATLGGATLVHPAFAPMRRGFWLSFPAVLLLTAPWLWVSWGGIAENSRLLLEPLDLAVRLQQFVYETSVAIPFVGLAALAVFGVRRSPPRERAFLLLCLALFGVYALATPLVQSSRQMWEYGLRYTNALLPFGAAATGVLVARAANGAIGPALALAALFLFTHVPGNLALWAVTRPMPAPADRPAPPHAALHRPAGTIDTVLRTELSAYTRELFAWSLGTDSRIIEYLREHAAPGDALVTNYAWEPLYFHTRLPQAYKVLESYPILAAAREAGLPAYVFAPDSARWLVWRAPWEGYQEYRWTEVAAKLRAAGRALVPVAQFPETIWENRENLHFRRFPGVGHLYPNAVELVYPPARIWRIDRAPSAEEGDARPRSPASEAPRDARD